MSKRKIINIDQNKCDGCGLCLPNCPEGAIQIIDNKARLVSDLFCDGLGACLGHCPKGAITIEERDAQDYDERKVMENIVKQGKNVVKAHLEHLKEHNEDKYLNEALNYLKEKNIEIKLESPRGHAHGSCPGSQIMDFRKEPPGPFEDKPLNQKSQLKTWPVQLMLVSPLASYLNDADLLISADCVSYAYANFHNDLLRDKVLIVGCPKLDDTKIYEGKLKQIIQNNNIKSITYAHMEVPCCFGLIDIIKDAIAASGKNIPFKEAVISIKGERLK